MELERSVKVMERSVQQLELGRSRSWKGVYNSWN